MATPSINDLVRYISTKLTGSNWNTNFQKIVDWFTDGNADLSVDTLTTTSDITVGGDITVTGDVTADEFIGDGSQLTGLNEWRKNFIINGASQIKNYIDYTLVKDAYGKSVDRFEGMATGTAVTAGTLTQITDANVGVTGFAIEFSGVTLTGTGEIYLRHRIYNKNAVNFKDLIGSFQMQVYHDVGSQVNYTIYVNKANALNDFSAVTAISDSGSLGVTSGVATELTYQNISFGDCTNGIEIEIKVECGAVTLKNFEFTEFQLELGAQSTEFEYRTFNEDLSLNNYDNNGFFSTDENSNFLVGGEHLSITSGAEKNVSIGEEALNSLTTGNNNIAIGYNSLDKNTTASSNIAIGNQALRDVLTNGSNLGIGYFAATLVTGQRNIAVGSSALVGAVTGDENVAVGVDALSNHDSCSGNVAVGYQALLSGFTPKGTGDNNVAIGKQAMYEAITGATTYTGSNNICIGYNSQLPAYTDNNSVRVGDTNIAYAGIQVAWTVTSDIYWKENIETSNLGLYFINQLKPVKYNRKNDANKKIEYGLIAQDLEKTLKDNNIENAGILTKDDQDKLHLRYNDLIPILIKAIQDQDKRINELEERVNGNTFNK